MLLRLWILLLSACVFLTACAGSRAPEGGDASAGEDAAELVQLVPDGERTHEEIAQGARQLCASARDSLARMMEEAEPKGAKAKEIAEAARAQWEPRLTELAALDYDALADAQIFDSMTEVSDIITAFREARDAIDALN